MSCEGFAEDPRLLECYAVSNGQSLLTFRKSVVPPFSESGIDTVVSYIGLFSRLYVTY